jgi:hypothetical protein
MPIRVHNSFVQAHGLRLGFALRTLHKSNIFNAHCGLPLFDSNQRPTGFILL